MRLEPELLISLETHNGATLDPESARDAGLAALAPGLGPDTRRVYAGAWRIFLAWCTSQDRPLILPVPLERIVAYVESLPPSLGPNGVKLRMAAIAKHHVERRHPSPTAHPAVRAALRRRQGAGQAVLVRLDTCGDDLAGLRNRALLLLVQVGGLAPADVAGLDRADLRFGEGELILSVRAPEASVEQPGEAVRLTRRRGDPLCPAQALELWLQRSGIRYGAVFRAISVHGTLEQRLGVVGVRRILRQIDIQAAAQVVPGSRKPARGAWRRRAIGKGTTVGSGARASAKGLPVRRPGPAR